MGVPGFFMWLWKKYKGTNFVFDKDHLNKKKDTELINLVNSIDYFLGQIEIHKIWGQLSLVIFK